LHALIPRILVLGSCLWAKTVANGNAAYPLPENERTKPERGGPRNFVIIFTDDQVTGIFPIK